MLRSAAQSTLAGRLSFTLLICASFTGTLLLSDQVSCSVGWTGNTAFKPYNERWKRVRRWYQKAFVVRSAARSYHSIQHREARKLLCDFAQDPGVSDFALKLKRQVQSIVVVTLAQMLSQLHSSNRFRSRIRTHCLLS